VEVRAAAESVDHHSSTAGLRAVATLEAVKGGLVLLIGMGLLTLLHRDVDEVAENLLVHLHINPSLHISHVFLDAASRMNDGRLWALAGAAAAYAGVRFFEAWGLWNRRVWAEWFALLSGGFYVPWEIIKVAERPNGFHFALLFANLAIICYMLYIRVRARLRLAG
jgi:uncharacterized membrane protein (DUF2068 family)